MTTPVNPLLFIPFAIPFPSFTAEHIGPAISKLLEDSEHAIQRIEQHKPVRTYDNTIHALDEATERLGLAAGVIGHLESVATTPEWRAAYNAIQEPLSNFYSRISLSDPLWAALRAFADTDEARGLTGAHRRHLEKTLDDFRREGAQLPPERKQRLREIDAELATVTNQFSQHTLDDTNAFELYFDTAAPLAGLPESALDVAAQYAKQKGHPGYRLTLQAPSYVPAMTYLDDASVREKLYRAYMTRASSGDHSNKENLLTILTLRHERALLLGYPNFSDYILENRMAKRASEAKSFVQSLYQRTHLQAARENVALQEFRSRIEGHSAPTIQAWDVAYYAEKQRKAEYDYDEEAVRAYFPAHTVIQGLFEVVQRLYGLTITKDATLPTWHPTVEAYRVQNETGRHVGSFYSDLYPRESKRGGAWMNAFIHGKPDSGVLAPHLGLICGNFTPPTETKPALLSHDEVNTLFHEFGHLLHHLLSEVPVKALGGTHVAWDFVELPSQIMENWVWQREVIDLLSGHYQTGEKLPADLFDKMVRARTFRTANFILRQLGFASLDLDLHTIYAPMSHGDILEYCRKHAVPFSAAPLPQDYSMITAFTHLFSDPVGYGSGYYSYLWAEVLDADAFTRFEKEGIWNRVTGDAFRRSILSRGNSDEPMALFREFMGREPSIDALLIRAGLSTA